MLKLNLREIASDLDVAIECFDEALNILNGYKISDKCVNAVDRQKLKKLSRRCIKLEALRDETGTMVLERAIHLYNVQEAVEEISKVREEFKDARELINI